MPVKFPYSNDVDFSIFAIIRQILVFKECL